MLDQNLTSMYVNIKLLNIFFSLCSPLKIGAIHSVVNGPPKLGRSGLSGEPLGDGSLRLSSDPIPLEHVHLHVIVLVTVFKLVVILILLVDRSYHELCFDTCIPLRLKHVLRGIHLR